MIALPIRPDSLTYGDVPRDVPGVRPQELEAYAKIALDILAGFFQV
jgi:hypothetical protein